MADSVYLNVGQSIQSLTNVYYKNIKLLGVGGNAATFLCSATSGQYMGNLFAVKIFRKRSREDRRESFLKEVEFLQTCNFPSIMRVYDRGLFCDNPFVVAEYCPKTLTDVIRENSSTLVDKFTYTLGLLSALNYLSNLDPQIVHRDIKPANIFINGSSCILGDFGLMKVLDGNIELDREVFKESTGVGMPYYYRTPDLVAYAKQQSALTVKSDIFQLGLVITELFTGRNPSKRLENGDDIYSSVEINPFRIEVEPKFDSRIYGQILTMLKVNPDERESVSNLLSYWQRLFGDIITSLSQDGSKIF
ncbi:serine/threonine kinase [Cylindrospermum sp. NIES-4074]|nr:serine/threonine kinase [Cylindrospermum sp. NIES-4074]